MDFVLLHILKIEYTRFKAMTSGVDNVIEKLFGKKKFILIAPDGIRLIAYGYKEAYFLSFSIFNIYARRVYEKHLKKTGSLPIVVFDIGANMGVFALKTAKRIPDQGRVVAIEPFPYNYKRLLENIRLNRLNNFITLDIALGDVNGVVPLWLPPSNEENTGLASTMLKISNHSIQVPVKTLTEVMKELNIESIDLLKCDAEGAELAILKGLGENIGKVKSLAIASEHFPKEAKEISEYLGSKGFRVRVESIGDCPYVYAEA